MSKDLHSAGTPGADRCSDSATGETPRRPHAGAGQVSSSLAFLAGVAERAGLPAAEQDGLLVGAAAFCRLVLRLQQMSGAALLGSEVQDDPRPYRAMAEVIAEDLNQNLCNGEGDTRQGYLRALTSLLCCVADGVLPGESWDPLAETAASFASGPDDDADLEGIFQGVMACEPVLTWDAVQQVEDQLCDLDFGRARRCGLAVASKGGEWFKQVSEDHEMAETVVQTLDPIESQVAFYRQLADVLERARTRLQVALCNHAGFDAANNRMSVRH